MERAEGWQERLHWSENGPPLAYESSDCKRSEFRYDTVGRLIASRNAEGETVQRCWDSRCRLTALQNENGEQYQFEWAADSLLLAHVGLAGVATRYDYDAAGRTVSRTFAAGHPQPVIHRYYWSRAVQLLARTTPEGQTRYHYSGGGQLGKVSQHLPLSDAEGSQQAEQEITFKYDALGRIVAEQGEQGELAWEYDALGNCTALKLPDARYLEQLHYGSGHLLNIALDNLPVTEFTRDTLHRELSRTQ